MMLIMYMKVVNPRTVGHRLAHGRRFDRPTRSEPNRSDAPEVPTYPRFCPIRRTRCFTPEVALRVLSIAVTSVEPETFFSDLKFALKSRQSRIKPQHDNTRICLKRWRLSKILPGLTFKTKKTFEVRNFVNSK